MNLTQNKARRSLLNSSNLHLPREEDKEGTLNLTLSIRKHTKDRTQSCFPKSKTHQRKVRRWSEHLRLTQLQIKDSMWLQMKSRNTNWTSPLLTHVQSVNQASPQKQDQIRIKTNSSSPEVQGGMDSHQSHPRILVLRVRIDRSAIPRLALMGQDSWKNKRRMYIRDLVLSLRERRIHPICPLHGSLAIIIKPQANSSTTNQSHPQVAWGAETKHRMDLHANLHLKSKLSQSVLCQVTDRRRIGLR